MRASVETRFTAVRERRSGRPILQLAPFVDLGGVWNHPTNPNLLPSQNFLAGIGAGVIWEPVRDLVIRLDGGRSLVTLPDKGNNLQEQSFYFSMGYRF